MSGKKRQALSAKPQAKRQTVGTPLMRDGHLYWPPLFGEAVAILEVSLEQSEDARAAYSALVEAWALPDCRTVIARTFEQADATGKRTKMSPDHAQQFQALLSGDSPDCRYRNESLEYFIIKSFNTADSLENQAPKVKLLRGHKDRPTALFICTIIRSLSDCIGVRDALMEYRNPPESMPLPFDSDINSVMIGDPSARQEKKFKSQFIDDFRRLHMKLKHDEKLLRWGEVWFLARVSPGTLVDATMILNSVADGMYNDGSITCHLNHNLTACNYDPSDINKTIAPYDDAAGYPRR